ncbi:alcohol dehydrogenase [Myxozyma melibiosi]|uniref:Alcohol dehydrogenase n=1 Tax=Myxozyma melibiosi TaxID=54550 RepID=A0ABR1FF94_9ASCO
MASTMKQLVYPTYTTPDKYEFRQTSKPEIKKPDEVLVKVIAASVNPIDVKRAHGDVKILMKDPFPSPIGYDVSGVVESVGSDVTTLQPGTAVYARLPDTYRGTFQEYLVCAASDLTAKPSKMSYEDAAALPLVSLTALQCFENVAKKKPEGAAWFKGKTVLVLSGLSGAGAAACQLAKNVYGAGKVICTVSTAKVPLVPKLLGEGVVDQIIDYRKEDPTKAVEAQSVDYLFDTLGSPLTFLHTMKKGGEISSLMVVPPTEVLREEIPGAPRLILYAASAINKVMCFRAGRYGVGVRGELLHTDAKQLERISQMYLDGKISVIIAEVAQFSDEEKVKEVFTKVKEAKGYTGKMVVRIGSPSMLAA